MDVLNLGKQFVTTYYNTLQANKMELISLYGQDSVMTYGGDEFKGLVDIKDKIESFGFQKVCISN